MSPAPRFTRLAVRPLMLAAAAALLVGCGPEDVTLTDDIDIEWDLFTLDRPSDTLHLPYVRGTEVTLALVGDDVTADMRIVAPDSGSVAPAGSSRRFHMRKAGDHVVTVVDGDNELVRRRTLPVRVPDRVEIRAHGPLIVDRPAEPLIGAQVLVGGTATFLVNYFEGSRPLFGNDVLEIEAPPEVHAVNRTSYLFENREWLTVTVREPGTHTLRLFADGAPVGRFTVIGVEPERVEAVDLHHDRRENKHETQRLVWAEPVDLDGETLFGVEFEWDLDGRAIAGLGDVFRYEVDTRARSRLTARFGEAESATNVHADWGRVTSTNDIGCAVGGAPVGGGGWLAVLGLALFGLRRRFTGA